MIKVLFLEDDVVLAETVCDLLEEEEFSVVHTSDGSSALDKARDTSFDLYLFDVNVPGINGFNVLRTLRSEGDDTAAFFITALKDILSMGEGVDAGADDYIKKPFDPEELILKIKMKLKSSVKIEKLEEELESVTQKWQEDFLTKVKSRRALEAKLLELDALYHRYQHDFAFVFVDIDFFKKVNDTYGHKAGDRILELFAGILKENARDIDFIARYGGEEFVVILPETTMEGAFVFAEKVRKSVASYVFKYEQTDISLTMSAGLALRSDVQDIDSLVKKADHYVYEAKEQGRDRVLPNLKGEQE